MAQGTVKWFDETKGYGFISPDGGGEDLFVHYSGIAGNGFRTLDEGEKVSYEATRGRKGMQAEGVSAAPAAKSPESGPMGGDGDPGLAPMGGGDAEPNPAAESKVKS
jgi:cold shock protein